jgi:hypothetical protein
MGPAVVRPWRAAAEPEGQVLMKAAFLSVALLSSGFASAADQMPVACPPGEPVQWIADYCMARLGTDDEIAASDCISKESEIMFRSSCTAKLHFKRSLCEVLVKSGTRKGTVNACVDDPAFFGTTVLHGGVGA